MSNAQEIIMVILCVAMITSFVVLKKYYKRKVTENSIRYKALLKLNEQYHFRGDVKGQYVYARTLKTKAQFDRFNFDKYFTEIVEGNIVFYADIIKQAKDNQTLLTKYKNELSTLPISATKQEAKKWKVPHFICQQIENKLIQNEILFPVVSPAVICKISYTSPRGKNSYANHKNYLFNDIIEYCELAKRQIQARNTKEYQRKLMTPSMRYDILKRDNQRCVICGRSEKDGVKLHVDHIVPINKGGKTVPENLRTLCDECNFGKSDKYDPNGTN